MQGTRQQRLSDPGKIRDRIKDLLDKKINIVFADNRNLTGVLRRVDSEAIVVENMRLKRETFKMDSISEIYFDTLA